ncbi:hypothetical protein [Streptomyces sp. NPDC048650]|uniref:hypothetical protein n=1 Tax=unclassified Streptomyces TaxID=2593676 RepID=UPI00371EA875
MSSASLHSASVHPLSLNPVKGATALGSDPARGTEHLHESHHVIGNALRAVKVYVAAAFSVVVMGEYSED